MANCQDCGKPYTFSAQEIAMDPRPPYRCKACRDVAQSNDLLTLLKRPYGNLTGGERKQVADEITALRARLEAVEKERDDYRRLMGLERQIADKHAQRAERAEAALATARMDDLVRLRDAVEGAQHWLTVSLFTNAEHARAKEQLAYVIAEMDALIEPEGEG